MKHPPLPRITVDFDSGPTMDKTLPRWFILLHTGLVSRASVVTVFERTLHLFTPLALRKRPADPQPSIPLRSRA